MSIEAELATLKKEIELLRERLRPIPVGEKLPTHNYSVLGRVVGGPFVFGDGDSYWAVVSYIVEAGGWVECDGQKDVRVEISHWMDLPPETLDLQLLPMEQRGEYADPSTARHAEGCFNDQPQAVDCQVCGGTFRGRELEGAGR